ncbi:MAG: hypothetical protein ACJ76J_05250 [Thermoanaerobaculia bacterium]
MNPEGASQPRSMTAFAGRVFFLADTPQGRELWRSDGTPEGTERVLDLHEPDTGVRLARTDGAWSAGELSIAPETLVANLRYYRLEGTGFRVQARLASGGQSRLLRKAACASETFCLGDVPGQTDLLLRVTGPRPNGYLWPMLARFAPATMEVWIEQSKTGKVRYYRLAAPPAGSSALDGLVDRLGFKR